MWGNENSPGGSRAKDPLANRGHLWKPGESTLERTEQANPSSSDRGGIYHPLFTDTPSVLKLQLFP